MNNSIKSILVTLLLLTTMLFVVPVSKAATVRYVSLSGSDTTGTGAVSNPYFSLRRALNASSAGDTIVMRGGDYTAPGWRSWGGMVIDKSHITIKNYPGEKVVIDGKTQTITSHYAMIMMYSGSTQYTNITFYGLNFSNCSGVCIMGDTYIGQGATSNITISHCEFYNITQNAVYMFNEFGPPTNYIWDFNMNNCTLSHIQNNASMGECISLGGLKRFVYENNTLGEFTKQGLCIAHASCYGTIKDNTFDNKYYFSLKIDPNTGTGTGGVGRRCHHLNITRNLFMGAAHNSVTAIFLNPEEDGGGMDNVTIEDNIINVSGLGSYASNGIKFTSDVGGIGIVFDRVKIQYNTIYCASYSVSKCITINEVDSKMTNNVIANNILITGASGNQVYFSDLPKSQTNFTFKNNLYFYTAGVTLGVAFSDDSSEFETGSIVGNPLFQTLGSDFHLRDGSPAIDAASSSYTVAYDYDNNPRPLGDGYDIGAYENGTYVPPVIPPVTPPVNGSNNTDNESYLQTLDITLSDFVSGGIFSSDIFIIDIPLNMTENTTLNIPNAYVGKSWWFFTKTYTINSVIVYGITQECVFELIPSSGSLSDLTLEINDIDDYIVLVVVPNPGYFQTSLWWFSHLNDASQIGL